MEELKIEKTGIYLRSKVAEYFDVSTQTIANWIETGILSGGKMPGTEHLTYVTGESILNLIDTFPNISQQIDNIKKLKTEISTKQDELDFECADIRQTLIGLKEFSMLPGIANNPIVKILLTCRHLSGETERDKNIFKSFLCGESFNDISIIYGLTRERVRQIVFKMIRRIEVFLEKSATVKIEIEKLQKYYNQLKMENASLRKQLEYHIKQEEIEEVKEFGDTLLWELKHHFSVRLQNCLGLNNDFDYWFKQVKDNNLSTINELINNWDSTKLLKLRNFGTKSLRELQEFLEKYGLKLRG